MNSVLKSITDLLNSTHNSQLINIKAIKVDMAKVVKRIKKTDHRVNQISKINKRITINLKKRSQVKCPTLSHNKAAI